MDKYRVAVIIAGIDETYQSSILNGIESCADEFCMDVSVFVSFSGTMGNLSHDAGEFNIFSLPDFSLFDGAVLLTNTIAYPPVVSDIMERIRKAGIPAVSIDNDVEEMYYIGIDNRTAMREITEHFIKVHGFTKFNYISGPMDNPEGVARLEAFLEVLRENNLTIEPERIYYGDFRAPSGKAGVEYFLKNNPYMPEAIICANDVMAATAINRLFESGYKVPEEICVSGFDNTYGSHNYQMELTSVERPLVLTGQLACRVLYNHFKNIPQSRSTVLDMSARFTESCGCGEKALENIEQFKALNYTNYKKYEVSQTYLSIFNRLSCELLSCDNFEQYLERLKKFVVDMNPREFYFCLCEGWDSEEYFENQYTMAGGVNEVCKRYTDEVLPVVAYIDGEFVECEKIKTSQLIPDIDKSGRVGKFYYFTPLHFGERCLGYMAIGNSRIPLHNTMFQAWCITISNSLENMRKLICLNYALEKLGRLFARDTFTNIYNRNGFIQATKDVYRECVVNHTDIMLMFIDLDGLKQINDNLGHKVGDIAICGIAEVLVKSCTKGEIYCRFGGDEFVVFASGYTESDAENLTDKIQKNIAEYNEKGDKPFALGASTGYIIASPKEGEDLFRFVTEADKEMYKEKKKKKRSRYLKAEDN